MKFTPALLMAFLLLVGVAAPLYAQKTFPYNGVKDHREGFYAFTNATVVISPDLTLDGATLLIRNGKILGVGKDLAVPNDAVTIDLQGKYITPSFVDLYTDYGMPETKRAARSPGPQMLSDKPGAYGWNEALHPEFQAVEAFSADEKQASTWRKKGFGAVLSHRMDGISRGSSVLVSLAERPEHQVILQGNGAHHLSFRKGSSSQDYPSSLMGCIALLRQTWYDARWYAEIGQEEEKNLSLEAWNALQTLPHVFEVGNKLELFRAARIGREFGLQFIFKGSGDEYQRVDAIAALKSPVILPVNFPKPFDLSDPYDSEILDLSDLKHWELAPSNAARLHNAGITIALTMNGSEKAKDWLENVRNAIDAGLPASEALRALTITPATLVGADGMLGTIEKGKWANFLVSSGPVFDKGTKIYHNWVQGIPYIISDLPDESLEGSYRFVVGPDTMQLQVKGAPGSYSMTVMMKDSSMEKVKASVERFSVSLAFPTGEGGDPYLLSGVIRSPSRWNGGGTDPEGNWLTWSAESVQIEAPDNANEQDRDSTDSASVGPDASVDRDPGVMYPFTAFGREAIPEQTTVLFSNATVWTNEGEGILKNADVLVRDGKIAAVGKDLSAPDAVVVDGTGKHLTCGIIDEHSHIAVSRGINEGTQASSAEVRIGDAVDSEDVEIYRQLAGGVTAAQLLHGSANPIGGQSALVKLRWGMLPEDMLIDNAPGFIKFALGENVKQSNWGDNQTSRYPQTRMGVEQVFEEYFTRAKEYGLLMASGKPYRTDLELEALLEILRGERFITCHSYQQGEINMLMKVAERHGFRVNTFTHILEGYKVADIMAAHGVAGSSFSDWWAYKYEVIDAIPYNGALMHQQGVLTGFNSDDAEMARRLNQEAAKAVKYGGVPEEEAWKFVTLNPAKMLHLDDRMGSIRVGKDADLVLWSGHPLSVYSRAEQTWVDGRRFFDLEEDQLLKESTTKERNRIIRAMLKSGQKSGGTRPAAAKAEKHYHCDDVHDEGK